MMKKIGILVIVGTILASTAMSSVLACHTRTPGYWKNHKNDWPTGTITLGADTYTTDPGSTGPYSQEVLLAILKTPPKEGNPWIILAKKVIALQLSMLEYGWTGYSSLLAAANAWLASPGDKAIAIGLAETIDEILNDPAWIVD